ncbi:F-box/LRR-repeat protein 6 isoform X2 [Syngnathoides biaculeatus]|nr:F-box/LRR-repeat protein 6 isoform X2 [Syngnathoides biaculeatus]XP_061679578.1 F-box/LRR-repeat protein 6 isoform X2 [Syngnathoides biaculeatus]XP_061679587.1 F-box/LRR-repeat protein 6 isoform X2 [Syngnathoides biaculeatus]XP_061679594.1 F-box/LRR-repeat protein 6 isoform X2 [Syngnathoides biaculeatus]XP_061679601.1 F-box/LRR-repeat protein 6 isoform X2 [Syngnathoides biaculeatus]
MASTEGAVEDTFGRENPRSQRAKKQTANKKKKARANRTAQPSYTVHQGEDMLLVISSSTSQYDGSLARFKKKRGRKKKIVIAPAKKRKSKASVDTADVEEMPADRRWGESLPEEVLVNIFKMVVTQDGAVPFLCRAARVCRLWHAAAATPALWRKVAVGRCWIAPGKSQQPKVRRQIQDTVDWLAQNRFSQLREFSLHHWTANVDHAMDVVSQFCPHLSALTLSFCTGPKEAGFQSLGRHGRSLRSLNLQHTEFQLEGFLAYLDGHGAQIQQIWFTHSWKNDRILAGISVRKASGSASPITRKTELPSLPPRFWFQRGLCPHLELLEVNTRLDSKDNELAVCVQALQMACPKLKTFRLLNVRPVHKTVRSAAEFPAGFPLLEELCIATASYSYVTDRYLRDILFGSPGLRVLDLRGCSHITSAGLAALPCLELECLFWGQYFSSPVVSSSLKKGLHAVAQKWKDTLRELDLANQLFSEEDLELAMLQLARANNPNTLHSLNLSGTRITAAALRPLIGQTTALDYLNLSSCRSLPRGLKRLYRGQEAIRQLLDTLE